jgi:general L-amino acid transport system permease protein
MTTEALPPPSTAIGPIAWLRRNLFSGVISSIVTIVMLGLIAWLVFTIGQWAIAEARWSVVTANLRLFLIGQYPADFAWRLWLNLAIVSVLSGLSAAVFGQTTRSLAIAVSALQLMLVLLLVVSPLGLLVTLGLLANAVAVWVAFVAGRVLSPPSRWLTIAWLITIPISYALIHGIGTGFLPDIAPGRWGGLLLTVMLALVGIILSFPLGVLLALGRRSSLPAARILSTAYIELIRGVPLITLLFMADLMLPLLLPGELRIDRVVRAMGGITLFSAAYVAENVRGGLQAIPSGHVEAAQALGLNPFQTNLYIVLPQALRSVIPANVGLFISLLKDTTLVTIIGLFELLGIGRAILAQPESLGAHLEVYVFIAAVFFVLCYAMSQASYRLERALGVGTR